MARLDQLNGSGSIERLSGADRYSLAALIAIVVAPGHLRWLSRYRYLWLSGGLASVRLSVYAYESGTVISPCVWSSGPPAFGVNVY